MNASAATSGERDAALRLLVAHRLPTERPLALEHYRQLFASGELDPAGLFVARGSWGRLQGAMVVSVLPGAVGLALLPQARRRNRTTIEDALTSAACDWLRSRGVKVCQAFGNDHALAANAALIRAGFQPLTSVLEMSRELREETARSFTLSFESFSEANQAAFHDVLLRSFTGSLDCPEMNGTRTEEELLAAYQPMRSESWYLARRGSEVAGVVMLHPAQVPGVREVLYLGLVPQFRGLGLGAELVCFARSLAWNSGATKLVLNVDERNHPARRLYETQGFQASGARSVFLANWASIS